MVERGRFQFPESRPGEGSQVGRSSGSSGALGWHRTVHNQGTCARLLHMLSARAAVDLKRRALLHAASPWPNIPPLIPECGVGRLQGLCCHNRRRRVVVTLRLRRGHVEFHSGSFEGGELVVDVFDGFGQTRLQRLKCLVEPGQTRRVGAGDAEGPPWSRPVCSRFRAAWSQSQAVVA